jgi:hypothetical protein
LDHWQLWFPARLGPARKATATVAGHKIKTTRRRLELPPTQNDRLHYRVKGPWVKEWREAAREVARSRFIGRSVDEIEGRPLAQATADREQGEDA